MCDLSKTSTSVNLNNFKTIDGNDTDSDTTIIMDCDEDNFQVLENRQPAASNYYSLHSAQQDSIELQSILSKYSNFASTSAGTSTKCNAEATTSIKYSNPITKLSTEINNVIELSSDEEDGLHCIKSKERELFSKLEDNKALSTNSSDEDDAFPRINLNTNKQARVSDNINTQMLDLQSEATNSSPKKKRRMCSDKENKKIAQQTKKQEAEKEKLLKQALAAVNKNLKPEECLKLVTASIDNEIASEKYGGEILNALQAAEIAYRLQPQLTSHTITWNLKIQKADIDDMQQPMVKTEVVETKQILLILNWEELVELVHKKMLITHIESLQSIFLNRNVFLGIYGLENYFKYHKSKKQKEVRSQLTQEVQKSKKQDKAYENVPKIDRKQLERSLTELQLLCDCCYRFLESPQDIGSMIVQLSKSIAQAASKLKKYQKQQQAEWYVAGDNKDCVRVDKNGNGLKRLWQQQLTSFPLARLELAEAIIGKFDTPSALFKEYDKCSQDEKERLLQEIPIRRAAGPLSTVRKIGPEFSKKVCKFFNSLDGNAVL